MKKCQPLHFTYALFLFLTGFVPSWAGIMYRQKNDAMHRISRGNDETLPARRNHHQLTGAALREELVIISESLNDMIQLCNESYTTPLHKLVNLESQGVIPDEQDKTTKCYLYCMLSMMGVTGLEVNKYDADQTVIMMAEHLETKDKAIFKLMANNCGRDVDEHDPCEGAYTYFKCIVAGTKTYSLLNYSQSPQKL